MAAFLLRLRGCGVRDLAVLRAFESVPRALFVPPHCVNLAAKDIALPLPCGQTMAEPRVTARAMEALRASPQHRVLEIGAGSGYATAVLARLHREVLAVERFRSLVVEARARLAELHIGNATVVWGDGLEMPADTGLFDRILIHAEVAGLPSNLAALLSGDGIAIYARSDPTEPAGRQWLVRAERGHDGDWIETPITPSRLRPLLRGTSLGS